MKKNSRSKRQGNNFSRILRAWCYQHAQAFFFSLGQLFKAPTSNLLSIAVIGISLALPTTFYLILDNSQRIMDSWDGNIKITLYLQQDTSEKQAKELLTQLQSEEDIVNVRFISSEEALEEYKTLSGFNEALNALEENPLPSMLVLTPALESISSSKGEQLLERLNYLKSVETAQFDNQWVKRLLAILQIMQRAVYILSSLLAIAVLLIVGNTIRLAIYNRRTEIEVNKLFGATNAFVQRPFLYTGFIHGLTGSLMAWIMVEGSLFLLDGPIERLAALYHTDFALSGLGLAPLTTLLASGAVLGIVGSWLAVQKHLRDIDFL